MNLNELIPNNLRFSLGNLTDFLYLCTRKTIKNLINDYEPKTTVIYY